MTRTIRLGLALILFLLSLLAVVPAQVYHMWRISVGVTELGHYLAIAALLLIVVPGWRSSRRGVTAAVLSLVAMVLFLTPVFRALPIAGSLPVRLRTAFGEVAPRSLPGARARTKPLSLRTLFSKAASPEVTIETMPFVVRDGVALELDLYRRADAAVPRPLVITIYGGWWRLGKKTNLPELNYYLASRGYAVAAVSYRFAPEHPFPAQTLDVNAAITYLEANARKLGIDSTRIVLIGRSAGGQLALQSAYRNADPAIRGVVSFYGPNDQIWGWNHPTNPLVSNSTTTLRDFLHGDPKSAPDAYREASPLNFVGPATVPTLQIHGTIDPLVSIEQGHRLDSALAAAGRPHFLLELPWATHGCDYFFRGPCGQLATYAIERFLASVM